MHHPVLINQNGQPPAAEEAPNFIPFIGQQRKADVVLARKLLMGLEAVTTDAQNLGIELFKALEVTLKSL